MKARLFRFPIMLFLTIFIIIPLIEIAVFIAVGDEIGLFTTLILCFLTAAIGGFLVKEQGLETLIKGQKALSQGYLPLEELFDGFCIVISGAMLLTPGFVTDFIGFSLLIPTVRAILRKYLAQKLENGGQNTDFRSQNTRQHNPDIIEGDFERVDTDENKRQDS